MRPNPNLWSVFEVRYDVTIATDDKYVAQKCLNRLCDEKKTPFTHLQFDRPSGTFQARIFTTVYAVTANEAAIIVMEVLAKRTRKIVTLDKRGPFKARHSNGMSTLWYRRNPQKATVYSGRMAKW